MTSSHPPRSMDPPLRKRPRCGSAGESSLPSNKEGSRSRFGLVDLFGNRRRQNAKPANQTSDSVSSRRNHGKIIEPFFTFRLEHREGGSMAQHCGEERILLFRSDQPGVIAKTIYSSTPAEERADGVGLKIALDNGNDEIELRRMAQAKVHVLSVKERYRGFGLGGFLFAEAMSSLRYRYHGEGHGNGGDSEQISVRCQLDAEEDIRRHNKLVAFYEQHGFKTKAKAKISYINNNDDETYRKIPMQIVLRHQDFNPSCMKPVQSHGNGLSTPFLPVVLLQARGKRVCLSNQTTNQVDWLALDSGDGFLQFRTTMGRVLVVEKHGECKIVAEEECETCNEYSKFQLLRVWGARKARRESGEELADAYIDQEAWQKELWMLKSTHESFLTLDRASHFLSCSKEPCFWQIDDHGFSLTCTMDTPPRRQHYRSMWAKQTVEYVHSMRNRYLKFSLPPIGLKNALDLMKDVPANPFLVGSGHVGPSLRSILYRTAETAREQGHPDWVQFVALIHGLASVLNCIDSRTATESDHVHDWTICSSTRVVGCLAPDGAEFDEFRGLNSDERDTRYNTREGIYDAHCGFENVLMAWTGPEYMYHMTQHNHIELPEEGLAMLRLFMLSEWHGKRRYGILTDQDDEDFQLFVADFDELRRATRKSLSTSYEMSDDECNTLWNTHYAHIASKYGADGLLKW